MASSSLSGLNSLRITPLDDDDEEEQEKDKAMEILNEADDDADDDDDEEEEDEGVVLGFVEKPKNPESLLRHFFPSKAGGVPAWLDPVKLPNEKSRTCGICREPLQFLLQIYAPISEIESAFHRTLYVFMCPSMKCLRQDQHEQWKRGEESPCRSVKVFRCQLPRSNPFYSSEPPKHGDRPLTDAATLCCWCGTWKGEKVCSSCKTANYCSEKHQILHWNSGHKAVCCQFISSLEASTSDFGSKKMSAKEKVACKTLYPEFEVIIEEECEYDTEPTGDQSCTTSLVSVHDKSDETFQLLSDKFEGDIDKKSWVSFEERISKAPEQVLRYCRDLKAKPLWPLSSGRPSKEDIPKCKYCKGPLCYEFQIMPQLLYYFKVGNDPDSLDWGTIVIYTCLASCEASLSYKEEFAWVQLYPTGP
ncbi:programmed cell death protein 2 [Iris pallida]|uniref:Programmed cell death protein 2 n=1 Tax=Iris pallida TaxID=29817 RepID=A0AAX6F8S6_IRIPA|nr:programmed cell death protein 2 [Iris pallida]